MTVYDPPHRPRRPQAASAAVEAIEADIWDELVTGVWHRVERHDTVADYPLSAAWPATAVEPAIPTPSWARRIALVVTSAAVVAALAIGIRTFAGRLSLVASPAALYEAASLDDISLTARLSRVLLNAEESCRARHSRSAAYRDLWRDSVWYHPLADAMEQPKHQDRRFGARRRGKRPAECGRGHCGVDLGNFGLLVRAAKEGVVEVVQRQATEKEGRYVRILHDDGYVSFYMHLHRIRDDLRVGMRVAGGEPVGVVGRTGIKRSPPHLHFALAFRVGTKKIFVDPEPLLRRALVPDADAPAL